MILNYETYKDKVMGCWAGKNIGGVLGAPFEGFRQYNDIDFYIQDLSDGPPPNDDLDLQIVWLAAVERYGCNVNASILGDYWLSYIIPNWVEYGMGKANLRAGFVPPISGELDNVYKDSCGCFIRSELWACLAPGHPEIAARYAYEDAIVDHQGDGMYGEIFCAVLQSAAFVESDKRKLIDIALSYIPESSALTKCVREAVECYDKGVDFKETRIRIHNTAPGTFGIQNDKISEIKTQDNEGMELGEPGFDAAENVGFMIAGWLYGNDDFGRSLCLAVACGEDTDCTAATLGALMGIISGASQLPEKWTAPLDDKIVTMCIDNTSKGIWIPSTSAQLADRCMRSVPAFLGQENCDILTGPGYTIKCQSGDDLYCNKQEDYIHLINGNGKPEDMPIRELTALSPYVVRYEHASFKFRVDYCDSIYFNGEESKKIKVTVINSISMRQQQWAKISLYVPDGVTVIGSKAVLLPLNNLHGSIAETTFEIQATEYYQPKLECIIDVSLEGRHSSGQAKIVLARK